MDYRLIALLLFVILLIDCHRVREGFSNFYSYSGQIDDYYVTPTQDRVASVFKWENP
jgi:hypothetical protein